GDGRAEAHELVGSASGPSAPNLSPPLSWLIEPDPAAIRARLAPHLATQPGAAQLDPQLPYPTAQRATPTPLPPACPSLAWMPFQLKGLRARLRALGAGQVTVKKRGSPLDTDPLARQLSGSGPRPLVVTLTQVAGRPAALICGPPGQGQA